MARWTRRVDPASGLREGLGSAWTGRCSGSGFRLALTWIRSSTSGFVLAGQRRTPRRRVAAIGGADCRETQCRGSRNLPWRVARVAPASTAGRRPCEGDFSRVFAHRGPGPGWTTEISRAVSRRRRPRPTHRAQPEPARPCGRDPTHPAPLTPRVSAESIAAHHAHRVLSPRSQQTSWG
jgi:hypothetical protein